MSGSDESVPSTGNRHILGRGQCFPNIRTQAENDENLHSTMGYVGVNTHVELRKNTITGGASLLAQW